METLQEAVRVATSNSAKRAALNTVLIISSALTLLGLAGIASALFFQNFVPHQVLSTPVYLQYGSSTNPYGVVSLTSPALKSAQDYDISLTLSLPPSPANLDQGNFMVSLHLLDRDVTPGLVNAATKFAEQRHSFEGHNILFSSRRPTLVPYVDPVVSLASRILFLFYHMLIPSSRTCEMTVPLAERVSFSKSSALPASAYLEIEAGQTLQTYGVWLNLTAQLRGLRWLMYHYRLPTYIAFTFLFWILELCFTAVVAYGFLNKATVFLPGGEDDITHGRGVKGLVSRRKGGIKTEDDASESSDHPHFFPTYGRQPPLAHEPKIKEENYERSLSELPIGGAEADDEDEEDGDNERAPKRDSGIGTSYSEEGSGSMRRRASRHAGE